MRCVVLIVVVAACGRFNFDTVTGGGGDTDGSTTARCVLEIDSGTHHACVVRSDHTLWCWGHNDVGQIGDDAVVNRNAPVEVADLGATVDAVSLNGSTSCARRNDGTLWCWGLNDLGQVGNGGTVDQHRPVQVMGLGANVVDVSAGWTHSCAVKSDGTTWCWGGNLYRQLGDGTQQDSTAPVQVSIPSIAVEVATTQRSACARMSDGSVWCWGDNFFGQVGDGSGATQLFPLQVTALGTNVIDIDGGGEHLCARRDDESLWCWGQSSAGQIGDGGTNRALSPIQVLDLGTSVIAIAAGSEHTCARTSDATWCWGAGSFGQIGAGTDSHPRPFEVIGLSSSPVALAAGTPMTFAVLDTNTFEAWGSNLWGALGTGAPSAMVQPPQVVPFPCP